MGWPSKDLEREHSSLSLGQKDPCAGAWVGGVGRFVKKIVSGKKQIG